MAVNQSTSVKKLEIRFVAKVVITHMMFLMNEEGKLV